MIEGCFHVQTEPSTLDERAERPWVERLAGRYVVPPIDSPDDDTAWERRCWLLDESRRTGTVKLGLCPSPRRPASRGSWQSTPETRAASACPGTSVPVR